MKAIFLSGTAIASILVSPAALAQSTTSSAPATADSGIQEIVVTAQRKVESSQKAGIAISVVSAADVVRQGVTQADQLGRLVPSLTVQSAGGANLSLFVRGVGNFTVNGYSDPAIAINYDGVYVGRPTSFSGMFYDLERVEVLKGPQGTLYGRNATGGAINILPAKPKLGTTSVDLQAGYGNYNAYGLSGAVNLPMGDNGAFRISANVTGHDGYLSDGLSDENTTALRAQMAAELTPTLKIRLGGDYSHTGGKGVGSNYAGYYSLVAGQYVFNPAPTTITSETGLLDPVSQAYRQTLFAGSIRRNATPLDGNLYQNNDFYGANAEIEWKTGLGTVTVIPAWRNAKLDNRFGVPAFVGYIQEQDNQTSVEARLNGNPIGIFDYVIGGLYYNETNKGNYTFSQMAQAAYQDFTNSTRSLAAFGRLTAHLTDHFRVIGGVRYTDDQKSFNGVANVVLERCIGPQLAFVNAACAAAPTLPVTDTPAQLPSPFVVPTVAGAPVPLAGGSLPGPALILAPTSVNTTLPTSKVTWRGALEFDIGPRSLAYASVETGYRSGGFSLAAGYETYQPETITAYTAGVKNRFLQNRLQLNVEAFLWKYRNQQLTSGGLDKNGNNGQFTQNVGRSTIKGVEVEALVLPMPNTLLRADVQYLDSVYDSFVYLQPATITGGNVLSGCAQTAATGGQFTVDCSGKPGFNSPKWTVNLGAQQTIPLGAVKLVASVDTQYKSSRYVQIDFLPTSLASSEWTTNAQIALSSDDDRWSLTAYIRNIENQRRLIGAQNYGVLNTVTNLRSAPRTYGLRAAVKF